MIYKCRNKENDIIGDIEYDIIPTQRIFYIEEITVYNRENRRKGVGSYMLQKMIETYHHTITDYQIVGISTNDAMPFWKRIGADFGEERKSGDMFFMLRGVKLFLYLRNKKEAKKNER